MIDILLHLLEDFVLLSRSNSMLFLATLAGKVWANGLHRITYSSITHDMCTCFPNKIYQIFDFVLYDRHINLMRKHVFDWVTLNYSRKRPLATTPHFSTRNSSLLPQTVTRNKRSQIGCKSRDFYRFITGARSICYVYKNAVDFVIRLCNCADYISLWLFSFPRPGVPLKTASYWTMLYNNINFQLIIQIANNSRAEFHPSVISEAWARRCDLR